MITKEKIKENFLNNAIEHGKAIALGDYKKANKIHKKMKILCSQAEKNNWKEVFSELLNESDESVRLWAATFTLKVLPNLAEKSLTDLSKSSSITGLTAKTTLHLWREGKLSL